MHKTTIRIGNLGAGVQSTTCYLLEREGLIEKCEAWIFADTGEEPRAVYDHLAWLESLGGTRIIRCGRKVKLGDNVAVGIHADGQRFVSIPAFTAHEEGGDEGITRRQCTSEYKISVIEQTIRRQILGLKHRQRVPLWVHVQQLFGLSDDEPRRVRRVKKNYQSHRWASPVFPLVELGWTRAKCVAWLKGRVPHEVPRSACVFCPCRSAAEWERLKREDAEGWARAVEVDNALRVPGNVVNRNMEQSLYVHRSCIPLEMVDVEAEAAKERAKAKPPDMFDIAESLEDCGQCSSGFCGM